MGLTDLRAAGVELLNKVRPGKRANPSVQSDQLAQLSSAISDLQSQVASIGDELRNNDRRLQSIEDNTSEVSKLLKQPRPRVLVPLGLFIALFGLSVALGFYFLPGGEVQAEMGGQFRVGVPYVVRDTGGMVQIAKVGWAESHGQDLSFLSQTLPSVPKVETGHT